MEKKKLERISELTAIARKRELTPEEQQERTQLRNEYRASVLGNLKGQLDNVIIVEPDGSKHPISPDKSLNKKK